MNLDPIFELLNETCADLQASENLPGLAAIIVHKENPIWFAVLGMADVDLEQPVTGQTLFHIGSATKVFTAILLAELVSLNKLQLADPLAQFIPILDNSAVGRVTLQQLVTHSSGLPSLPALEQLAPMFEFPPTVHSLEKLVLPETAEVISALSETDLLFAPGSQVAYSNLGFMLLGYVLEVAAGSSYAELLEKRLLHPLKMTNSGIYSLPNAVNSQAVCYLSFDGPHQAAPASLKKMNGFIPAGGMWTSIDEMAHFLSFLNGGSQLISTDSLRETTSLQLSFDIPQPDGTTEQRGIGLGWFLSGIENYLLAEHGGADPSTAAYVGWLPDQKLGLFIATNSGINPPAVGEAGKMLLEIALELI